MIKQGKQRAKSGTNDCTSHICCNITPIPFIAGSTLVSVFFTHPYCTACDNAGDKRLTERGSTSGLN